MTVRRVARRRTLRHTTALTAVALAATSAGCRIPPTPKAGCAPGAPPVTVPASSPWARTLCVQVSQQPPASLNGVLYRDGVLWMASLDGKELVAADGTTGQIIGRFGPDQGVTSAPDDLAMTPDGTIYWSGFRSGDIGVLTPDGRSRTLTNIGAGVNPMVLGPDGALYTSRFYDGSGFYRIDLPAGTARVLDPDLGVNAFAFGPDGQVYAGTMNTVPSQLLRIDPVGGQATILESNVALAASSTRIPPAARGEAPTTAYVLSAIPAVVQRRDIRTGAKSGADIWLPLPFADNMTFAPDGRLFVTGFAQPSVAILGTDGSQRVLHIGRG